jgi:alkylated DNA nucleotide flippase Atl1
MRKKKTWREKLADNKDLPKVVPLRGKAELRWGKGTIVIPAPSEVDALMRSVPRGRVMTSDLMRSFIARKHAATMGCPLTTGIFAWLAANAAEEAAADGARDITPYWRTLKSGGQLNPKYPGGVEAQKARLEAEGHQINQKGKNYVVAHYEDVLFHPGT